MSTLRFTDDPAQVPPDELRALLDGTYWAKGRTLAVTRRVLSGSYLVVAALRGARLVGFARVISDGVLHASIHDVVVAPDQRGQGLGRRIMEQVLAHSRLAGIPGVGLSTVDRMHFYSTLGFEVVGATRARFGTSIQIYRG